MKRVRKEGFWEGGMGKHIRKEGVNSDRNGEEVGKDWRNKKKRCIGTGWGRRMVGNEEKARHVVRKKEQGINVWGKKAAETKEAKKKGSMWWGRQEW